MVVVLQHRRRCGRWRHLLEADGNGTLTIQLLRSPQIAEELPAPQLAGGGGSGGSIRLAGKSITNNDPYRQGVHLPQHLPPMTVESAEAVGWPSITRPTGRGFSRCRQRCSRGNQGYNTSPTISSPVTASVTYSNDKYQTLHRSL